MWHPILADVADRHLGGLGDRYQWSLPFQWVDITGLPGGDYTIRAMVDPYDSFLETNETDSCAYTWVCFRLTGHLGDRARSASQCRTDWDDSQFETRDRLGLRRGHHRRLRPVLFCPAATVTRAQMAMFIGPGDGPADNDRGLLHG